MPAGSVQTVPGGGAGINITLTPGQNATGFLFGNQVAAPASIAGTKFNDLNGNGVRDAGETGMAGVSIQLKAPSGQTLLAATDANGAFSFTGLAAGTYVLSEIVPAGFAQTAPPSPGTISVTVTAGRRPDGTSSSATRPPRNRHRPRVRHQVPRPRRERRLGEARPPAGRRSSSC